VVGSLVNGAGEGEAVFFMFRFRSRVSHISMSKAVIQGMGERLRIKKLGSSWSTEGV
jgi:hypothetical protein